MPPSEREIEAAARVLIDDKHGDPEVTEYIVKDKKRYSPWMNLAKQVLEAAEAKRRLEN